MYGYSYTLPAMRGIQAGREYFVAMCPLKLLPKLFLFDEVEVPPELRAQRTINVARIPEIARYVLENRNDYAFSAITASIDGEVIFEAAETSKVGSDVGSLIIPMSAKFVINDGQHRRAAIEAALDQEPSLGDETIAVVFYIDAGLHRSQQLFADLNKHAVRPTKSIGILYDSRAPLANLARELANTLPCFRGLTELEKTTISNRSSKLFTLSGIHQATAALLGKGERDAIRNEERDLVFEFWSELGCNIGEWKMAADRKIATAELRRDFVHSHAVVLHAIGSAGRALIQQYPDDWRLRLQALKDIDWSRSNTDLWEGTAMIGGQMSKASQNIQLTTIQIKRLLGLGLSPAEQLAVGRIASNHTEETAR